MGSRFPQFTDNFIRFADAWEVVEVGMIRYVGSPVAGEDIGACVVTKILPGVRVWDPEYKRRVEMQQYQIRRATVGEETAYLALPRAVCTTYRVEV